MEQEVNDKLAKIKEMGTPEEKINLQSTKMLEQTKVLDRIFIKHELKYVDLQAAEKENNLRNEPQIIAFKNAIKAKHNLMKQQADVEAAKSKFTPEQQAEIDQVIAEKGPVRNTAGANGKLDDDEFWKAFEIIVTLQIRYQHRAIHDNASERRALLLSNQQPQYESIVQEMLEDIAKSKGQLGTAILGALSIEPNLYDRSA